ncbi:MAG: endonuclease/exonuclease/phosphatase family protein [Alistipes sp.]|nr:endonuclease/exonuclease/phosphatase family protein [Alistipes sp.]
MRRLITILLLLCHSAAIAQHADAVMFYNVENLFDTINNPATSDEDFLPLADREWNSEKYHTKLTRIASVIADLHDQCPTLVGLAEVENRAIVEELARQEVIASANYAICHYESPDERGIDVALMYRPDRFQLEGSRAIRAAAEGLTRDILCAWGEMQGRPTYVIVVHLPSRIGGVQFSEPERRACARQVREVVDSVLVASPKTQIIVMGDMNDNPRNKSIRDDLKATHRPKEVGELYNPFAALKRKGKGTSVYDGRWNMYDNIVVSQNTPLLPIRKHDKGAIYRRRWLLDNRGRPLSAYEGVDYTAGISDHLPIWILIGE